MVGCTTGMNLIQLCMTRIRNGGKLGQVYMAEWAIIFYVSLSLKNFDLALMLLIFSPFMDAYSRDIGLKRTWSKRPFKLPSERFSG